MVLGNISEITKIDDNPIKLNYNSFFKDSDRVIGIELPKIEIIQESDCVEVGFFPDSDRESSYGPQWEEVNLENIFTPDSSMAYEDELVTNDNKAIDNSDFKNANDGSESQKDSNEKDGLSNEEKQEIKEKTNWSDEIIDAIDSKKEAEIYMNAGLIESDIDGKKCLIRNDIDLDQKDEDGITNQEKMQRGRPPITEDGQEIELHHIGQKSNSPLAELTTQEHRGIGNDTILHDKNKKSEIDRNEFSKERRNHWKSRIE